MTWLEHPALKWFVPLPVLAALAPLLWLFFRETWARLDAEALEQRRLLHQAGALDARPLAAAMLGAAVLALQEYFGRHAFFAVAVRPALAGWAGGGAAGGGQAGWEELLPHLWWGLTRVGGYLLPLLAWKLLFRRDRLRDLGLRAAGLGQHLWIYAACVAVMVPVLLLARRQPDFGAYYPFYRLAGRSWADFLAWEAIYLAQFLALEIFFRGWWIGASRSLGAAAIFAVAVPYAMIHYGKPYFEAMAALVAGVVLGSLAARTRSIWAGFLVHATVAVLMDVASLRARGELPRRLAPGSAVTLEPTLLEALPWLALAVAALVLLLELRRRLAAPRAPA